MMKVCIRKAILVVFPFFLSETRAQDSVVFKFDVFIGHVMEYHPLARQARLLPALAKEEVRMAKGGFDPVVSTNVTGKVTKGDNTYTYIDPVLKVPTYPGIELKAGMDQTDGKLVNPERARYDAATGGIMDTRYRLFYAGVSVPVLRGLMTDSRRNTLQQARLMTNLNEADMTSQLNKLYLVAAKEYLEWQLSYLRLKLLEQNVGLASSRLEFIRSRILAGEEKPVDSIEAQVEVARREAMLVEARMEFLNAGISLSNFIWSESGEPVELMPVVYPEFPDNTVYLVTDDSLQSWMNNAMNTHPDILKLELKVKQSELERKLAAENIKPQLNVEYYPFQTYTGGTKDDVPGLLMKNYKFGLSFYSSLYLRKERGKLNSTEMKLKQAGFAWQQGRRNAGNQVLLDANELRMWKQQIEIQEKLVKNSALLRDAEALRFENGESSLFLVNQRERSLVETQVKLAELRMKYRKSVYQLQWASGKRLF